MRSLAAVTVMGFSFAGVAQPEAPPAGTRIVNQANVQYLDANAVSREATTNEVVLLVRPVYSSTLAQDNDRLAIAGANVSFTHTLTNSGNTENTYCVAAVQTGGDSGDYDSLSVVHDANTNGVAEANEKILYQSTGGGTGRLTLEAEATVDLVLTGIVPAGATVGQSYSADLTVSSQDGTGICGTGLPTDTGANIDTTEGTNRDTVTITDLAVLEITKSSIYNSGVSGDLSDDTIEYVLTVENNGNQEASDVLITDVLPDEVSFAAFGATEGAVATSHINGTVSITSAMIDSGERVIVRFTVDVDDLVGFAGEDLVIENTATVAADLDGVAGREPAVTSNTTRDMVPVITAVTLSDTGVGANTALNDGGDDDGSVNDIQEVSAAAPGDTTLFRLTVTNTGNVTDTYNLAAESQSGWLAQAGLTYFHPDGISPLLDTTSDGIADTGPLAPGESLTFFMRASLPNSETAGPHSAVIRATSTRNEGSAITPANDPASLVISAVQGAEVDIANSGGATGYNDNGVVDADPASSITTTLSGAPGTSVSFDLFVANEGGGPDTFALLAAASEDGATALPSGWAVRFVDSSGTTISSTPRLAAGESYSFTANVMIPQSVADGASQSVYFRVNSALTGASDVKQDAVNVSAQPSVTFTPDANGQVSPCGQRDYIHTLRNSGGTNETFSIAIASQTQLGGVVRFATSLSAGQPDEFLVQELLAPGDDVAVLSGGNWVLRPLQSDGAGGVAIALQPGEEAQVQVRVSASCSTANGLVDTLIVEATSLDGDLSARVTDVTRVGATMLQILKKGARDPACSGVPPTSFDTAQVAAQPGDCVVWQILLENNGNAPICDVMARDAAPAFTQLYTAPLIIQQPVAGTGSCTVTGDEFACTLGAAMDINQDSTPENYCLGAGETAEVRFSVRIE